MKNILLTLLLLSPYVFSESYSCTNELKNIDAWNKQVVFERNADEFISKSHSAFSINNKNFPMSEFNWEIYVEDKQGIFLVSQNGMIKRERGDQDEHSMWINVVFINKTYMNTVGYAAFDISVLGGFKNIVTAEGSCLIIED